LNETKLKEALLGDTNLAVFFEDGSVFRSDGKGIFDLLHASKEKGAFKGACVADKIVGRAAAFLYSRCSPDYLYAGVLSEGGAEILRENKISFSCGTLTEAIMNRAGTGICPMDDAVKNTQDADVAYTLILKRANELRNV